SLLPKYPGLNTHQKVIDNKDEIHGITIHYVSSELDGGPIIAQGEVMTSENVKSEIKNNAFQCFDIGKVIKKDSESVIYS
ncbi:MAG: hypothetical protein EBW00_04375, partial [Proteobacteria bacterium]|nr:hypothetical protein [Pseudomonadota bacterium]